jgi:hypothetical protein
MFFTSEFSLGAVCARAFASMVSLYLLNKKIYSEEIFYFAILLSNARYDSDNLTENHNIRIFNM